MVAVNRLRRDSPNVKKSIVSNSAEAEGKTRFWFKGSKPITVINKFSGKETMYCFINQLEGFKSKGSLMRLMKPKP